MAEQRPQTPPASSHASGPSKPPLTPEQIRRVEENRLKAKALRTQQERETRNATLAGQKRPRQALTTSDRTVRDARHAADEAGAPAKRRPHDEIQPARNFAKYVEYDFSKMTDTKGGFLTHDDDPHNRALHAGSSADGKPAHMTLAEWERLQLIKKLREQRAGPFEPGISTLTRGEGDAARCRECGGPEVDWQWVDVFGCAVCAPCRDKMPDKYSLLTKSEAREDYLLTEPELRDPDLLPRLEKPNPHKATWHNMMLFLRYQVEEYAFSAKKWGSGEALDAEFARREQDKKRRKETKFKEKLNDLKKRTRVDAYKRSLAGGGGGNFGDKIAGGIGEKHEHEWGRAVVNADGVTVKKCVECGMELEELEF